MFRQGLCACVPGFELPLSGCPFFITNPAISPIIGERKRERKNPIAKPLFLFFVNTPASILKTIHPIIALAII
jgi:hypothetical protein